LPPPPGRGEGDPDGDGVPPNTLEPEAVLAEESDPDGREVSAASRRPGTGVSARRGEPPQRAAAPREPGEEEAEAGHVLGHERAERVGTQPQDEPPTATGRSSCDARVDGS
jgi:hypothetical protein